MSSLVAHFLFFALFALCRGRLHLEIDEDNVNGNGFYSIFVDDNLWLSSGQMEAYLGHQWYTSNISVANDKQNKFNAMHLSSSSMQKNLNDAFGGDYNQHSFEWTTDDQKYTFGTNIKVYTDNEAISFQQSFTTAIDGTNYVDLSFVPKECDNFPSVVPFLSFPSFNVIDETSAYAAKSLGFLTWHNTFSYTADGLTPLPSDNLGGVSGGPVVLFDDGDNALLISSNDHFSTSTSTNLGINKHSDWSLGIAASVLSIPSNFTHETVIVYSDSGINDVVLNKWSSKILSLYPTERVAAEDDLLTSHIGYWTDNGAYYYAYNFRGNLSCCDSDVFSQVKKKNIDGNGIKIGYWQMDDWWMPSTGLDSHIQWDGVGAMESWYPIQPYFPGGLSELSYNLQVPLAIYGPYFSPNNIWKDEFEFIPKNVSYVLPSPKDSYNFYSALFDFGMNESSYKNELGHRGHGMIMYEVDFMSCLSMTPAFKLHVDAQQRWLQGMNDAAKERNISIQYCMAIPANLLSSLTLSQVTNGRASWDYASSVNWNIGEHTLLWQALKLKPSKDNFWTSYPQTPQDIPFEFGDDQSSCEVHAIVALMSCGPVGFSDSIGMTNATIIRRLIRGDGRLLQPNRPIAAMDDQMKVNAFGDREEKGINVWNTQSGPLQDGGIDYVYQIVMALDMTHDYVLNVNSFYPRMSPNYSHYMVRKFYDFMRCENGTDAVKSGCVNMVDDPMNLYEFKPQQPVKPSNESFELITVLPVANYMKEFVFIGEIDKYVSCSKHRFSNLKIDGVQSLSVDIKGDSKEIVKVSVLKPRDGGYILYQYDAELDETGFLSWKTP